MRLQIAPVEKSERMRYDSLDLMRGLAALWVFFYHFSLLFPFDQTSSFLHAAFCYGYLGVPMFFVISGYCMAAAARSALRREESVSSFLYRRMRRIYPPFWCSAVVTLGSREISAGGAWLRGASGCCEDRAQSHTIR